MTALEGLRDWIAFQVVVRLLFDWPVTWACLPCAGRWVYRDHPWRVLVDRCNARSRRTGLYFDPALLAQSPTLKETNHD